MNDLAGQFAILGGSLVAIFAIFALARLLGLGGDPIISSPSDARELAKVAEPGFQPTAITVDHDGKGALLLDEGGQVMLLRRHGARFAARMLDQACEVRIDQNMMTITTPDRFFGTTTLDLGRAGPAWAASFRRLAEQS